MLRKLDFVKWDRFVHAEDSGLWQIYGWIDRKKDSYKDFVLLEYSIGFTKKGYWDWITSSAEYDKKVAMIVDGSFNRAIKCQRVENNFKIKNSTKLKK